MWLPVVSKHLRVLENVGLIRCRKGNRSEDKLTIPDLRDALVATQTVRRRVKKKRKFSLFLFHA